MLLRIAIVGMVLLVLSSCQESSCYKSEHNRILGTHAFSSTAYQSELYRLIKESPDVDYYFEMYEQILGQTYLVVNAYGDAFCGKLCLVIPEAEIPTLERQADAEKRGAQLIGLRYTQRTTELGSALVYDSLEYIVE
ncbi:MAG: hypothetical protein ABNH00_02125 [Dokdonia sp.]|jgi:hypothetical protein|nr:hypothetical protein [Cytophagaceae bacterium]|tara:strand:- start:71 stop:481 length:411 start_codon:yes stop_codon:yes gene_type:complete